MAEKTFNIPYRSKLTERIEPGQTLIIRGRTSEEAKRFNINLHKDSPDFSGNDVPLHVSVRFDEGKVSVFLAGLFHLFRVRLLSWGL
ncbi:galactoside-binding lectin [Cooperia oncophora]